MPVTCCARNDTPGFSLVNFQTVTWNKVTGEAIDTLTRSFNSAVMIKDAYLASVARALFERNRAGRPFRLRCHHFINASSRPYRIGLMAIINTVNDVFRIDYAVIRVRLARLGNLTRLRCTVGHGKLFGSILQFSDLVGLFPTEFFATKVAMVRGFAVDGLQ